MTQNTGADFTIADVLAWARTKPADERYDFTESHSCAMAQFGKATGRHQLIGLLSGELKVVAGVDLFFALIGDCRSGCASTFGELVERLEKLCPETPVTRSAWSRRAAYMADIECVSA